MELGGIAAIIASGAVALLGLVALVGAFLPRRYEVGRVVRVPKGVDEVWKDLTDPRRMNSWRADLRRVLRLPGHKQFAEWIEVGWMSRRQVTMTERQERKSWVARADNGLFPVRARLRLRVEGNDQVSVVELREDGVIRSPFVRFLARFVIGFSVHIDDTLRSLAKHHGGEPELQDIE